MQSIILKFLLFNICTICNIIYIFITTFNIERVSPGYFLNFEAELAKEFTEKEKIEMNKNNKNNNGNINLLLNNS